MILSGERIDKEEDEVLYLMPGYDCITKVYRGKKLLLCKNFENINHNIFCKEQLEKYFSVTHENLLDLFINQINFIEVNRSNSTILSVPKNELLKKKI